MQASYPPRPWKAVYFMKNRATRPVSSASVSGIVPGTILLGILALLCTDQFFLSLREMPPAAGD